MKRKKKRKKVVKRREKIQQKQEHASINHLFPPFLANPLFGIPKAVISSHLGSFPKIHNLNSKAYNKVVQVGVWIPFWFTSCEKMQNFTLSRVFTYVLLQQLFIIFCCIGCSAMVSLFVVLDILLLHLFIIFALLAIMLAKLFLLNLSLFLCYYVFFF